MNEEREYAFTLHDYIEIAQRRWAWFVVPFVLLSAIAAGVAIWIPPVYESRGTILIESQQIPDELIRSTVTSYADERIQVIQQLVMTRENLLRIAQKFDLFPILRDEMTVSEQVDLMRQRISIGKVAGGDARSQRGTTIAFSVGFEDQVPARAHAVANELITLFLEENVKTRTARASETTEFLRQEAARLEGDLEIIEEQIANYKQENGDALPEHLDLHMSMLERTETRIKANELDLKAAEDELRFLEIERSAVSRGIARSIASPGAGQSATTPAQELTQAEAELERLKSIYSDRHPDVRRTRVLVENLRNAVALANDGEGTETADPETSDTLRTIRSGNVEVARVEAQIQSVKERTLALSRRRAELEQRRSELEATIIQTPQVQRALSTLTRDHDNTLAKYKEIQAKEMEAKVAESLEEGRKAERFALIEPPVLPERPTKPNRRKITLMGVVLAGLVGFGFVVALEVGDQRIRGTNAMLRIFGEHPLVTVPYITTAAEITRRRRIQWSMAAGSAAAVVVALVGIHFLYQPLDMLAIKVMARLG